MKLSPTLARLRKKSINPWLCSDLLINFQQAVRRKSELSGFAMEERSLGPNIKELIKELL